MTKRGLYLLALDCNLGTLKKDNVAKLNSNAKRQAQGFGTWLALHKSKPDLVICEADTLVKAYTEKLVKAMGATAELVESTAMLPVDGSADLLRLYLLRKIDQLLVVANEKPIRLLGNELLIDNGHLQQNSLLCLKVANPSPAAATEKMEVDIDNIVVANELPNQFPFPDINGSELRPRPAYYYRQSAVIPFRSSEQGIELLLISSSNRRHWLIPKGIHEPGMSAQASALKEAVEESGISGQALDYLGKYICKIRHSYL